MFITSQCRQHASHTLVSRVYAPQPHMQSSADMLICAGGGWVGGAGGCSQSERDMIGFSMTNSSAVVRPPPPLFHCLSPSVHSFFFYCMPFSTCSLTHSGLAGPFPPPLIVLSLHFPPPFSVLHCIFHRLSLSPPPRSLLRYLPLRVSLRANTCLLTNVGRAAVGQEKNARHQPDRRGVPRRT